MNSTSSSFRKSSSSWGSSEKASSASSKNSPGLFGSPKPSSGAFGGKANKCDCYENGKCSKSITKQPCDKKYDW